mmetsp:Transcript_18805/g.23823  ORF Transcript_18805/g.23823 Transcript_18805/m.23823 type:complete len:211 (+) Transcript_18805:718-1350(+)
MGDHSAHSPVFHAMQIFYFSAIFCLFQPLLCVRTIIDFRYRRSQMFCFFVATLVTLYCIRNYTYEHLYLLSDNRHYMFYIWNKFFRHKALFRQFLAPFYVVTLYITFFRFLGGQSILWRFLFFLCTCASLIPSELLEFRYFICPSVLALLHQNCSTQSRSLQPNLNKYFNPGVLHVVECVLYLLFNVLLCIVFVYFPITQEDGSIARFMW